MRSQLEGPTAPFRRRSTERLDDRRPASYRSGRPSPPDAVHLRSITVPRLSHSPRFATTHCRRFYRVSPSLSDFIGFYRILPGFNRVSLKFHSFGIGFYGVLSSFIEIYRVLPGITGFLPSFLEIFWVLPSSIEMNWVLTGF